jgi:hypothetical protein
VSGYTKKGWKCQNNNNVGFSFTLSSSPTDILADIDNIIVQILKAIGENSTNVQVITFYSIVSGSTVMLGSVTPSSSTIASTSSSLTNLLSSGSLGTYSVSSYTVTTQSQGTDTINSGSSSSSNVPLIVGLAVGIPLGTIILLIIGYIIYKKRE